MVWLLDQNLTVRRFQRFNSLKARYYCHISLSVSERVGKFVDRFVGRRRVPARLDVLQRCDRYPGRDRESLQIPRLHVRDFVYHFLFSAKCFSHDRMIRRAGNRTN